jgi:hypothetical protein
LLELSVHFAECPLLRGRIAGPIGDLTDLAVVP